MPIKISISTEKISNELIPIEEIIKDKKHNPGDINIVLMGIHEDKDDLIKLYNEVEKRFDKETKV